MKILVRRVSALGDVLCITPVITRLRQQYPNALIVVHTVYQNVFENNYAVNQINTIHEDFDLTIDLDGAHETRRHLHAIDAYMEAAFGDHGETEDKTIILNHAHKKVSVDREFVAVHAAKTWDNRTMPNSWWDEVVSGINKAGYLAVVLGTHIDYCPIGEIIDTRDKLDLTTQAAFIAASETFICGASGLFILAGSTETPVVVPLTLRPLETAAPYRHGAVGWKYYPLIATVPCFGCDVHQNPGATFVGCSSPYKDPLLPNYACISTIKAEEAIELAISAIKEKNDDFT